MNSAKSCAGCGKAYTYAQKWWHAKCQVVDTLKPSPVVVDAMANVVVDRNRDRHRKTEERREYLRLKQRESRARRVA